MVAKELVGKRILYTMTPSTQVPPVEAEVLEVSPSGNYIKLRNMTGTCSWEVVSTVYIADVLGTVPIEDMGWKRWHPAPQAPYWYVDDCGAVQSSPWRDEAFDRERFSFGNVFQTREQAEAFRDKMKWALLQFHRNRECKETVRAGDKEPSGK